MYIYTLVWNIQYKMKAATNTIYIYIYIYMPIGNTRMYGQSRVLYRTIRTCEYCLRYIVPLYIGDPTYR